MAVTASSCNRSCCHPAALFRVRLALATRATPMPGVTDITIHAPKLATLLAKYGSVADEEARHFIVQAEGLGLGGAA